MLIPEGINKEIGHFNVFKIADLHNNKSRSKPAVMPYNRRAYYKMSMIIGRNRAEYADKVIDIDKNALLFATPKIPYNYEPQGGSRKASFVFLRRIFCCRTKPGWRQMIYRSSSQAVTLSFSCLMMMPKILPRFQPEKCIKRCLRVMLISTTCCAIMYSNSSITGKNCSQLQPYIPVILLQPGYLHCSSNSWNVSSL